MEVKLLLPMAEITILQSSIEPAQFPFSYFLISGKIVTPGPLHLMPLTQGNRGPKKVYREKPKEWMV